MRIEPVSVQKPRLMMFSHDTFGLGHLRRCSTIAKACAGKIEDLSILYVTGATEPNRFGLPSNCDVVKLPALTKSPLGGYEPRNLDVSPDLVLSLRRGLVLESVRRYAPHVLLIDHAPLGAAGELKSALKWLRAHRPDTRVILGMRDVIDDPSRVAREFDDRTLAEVVREWFDDVVVYGDPRVFDPVEEYGLQSIQGQVQHVGYCCEPPVRPERGEEVRPRILVQAGGGEDGTRLYETVVHAFQGPLREIDVNVDILVGPFLSSSEREWVERSAADDPRIRSSGFRGDLPTLLSRSDLVVSMAGANTVAEILAAGTPSVLAPRRHPRKEQLCRALRLESLGFARVLDTDRNDAPEQLAVLVHEALAGTLLPRMKARPDCGGAENMVGVLTRAFQSRSVRPSVAARNSGGGQEGMEASSGV